MADFFECPVCGRAPKIVTYAPNVASAYCRGYIFHHHKKVGVTIYDQPSNLYKSLQNHWNQIHFREARFLYFREDEIDFIMNRMSEEEN